MGVSKKSLLWLRILTVSGASPKTWLKLREIFSLEEIVSLIHTDTGRERIYRLTGRRVSPPDETGLKEQLRLIEKGAFEVTSLEDPDYPNLLREIAVPPPLLYYRGDLSSLKKPSICIVGSRAATRSGLLIARRLAMELSQLGIHVVSGLARGVDTYAHIGALESGGGTSAVLGTGVDLIYPEENRALAERIEKEGGAIITEFPPGTPPHRHNFPRRNRLLSGLTLGTIVVQAGLKSGAMGTAMWALEQNRDVFAVPGSIESPLSRGPHSLIKKGAHLVESVEDVVEALNLEGVAPGTGGLLFKVSREKPGSPEGKKTLAEKIISALDSEPKHIDELVEICNISPDEILPVLLELEIRGAIVSCGGNSYALSQDGYPAGGSH